MPIKYYLGVPYIKRRAVSVHAGTCTMDYVIRYIIIKEDKKFST